MLLHTALVLAESLNSSLVGLNILTVKAQNSDLETHIIQLYKRY